MGDKDDLEALTRAVRVADQSCTGYSILRDRFRRRSMALDLSILLISTWLTAMVFVEPKIAIELSPNGISKDLWLGLLSIGAFGLSLVQLQVDWKGRAYSYGQAANTLALFVKEYRPILAGEDMWAIKQGLLRYQMLTDSLEPIPEQQFLALKQKHQLKVLMSRHLDAHPGTNLWLLRIMIRSRDNLAVLKKVAKQQENK